MAYKLMILALTVGGQRCPTDAISEGDTHVIDANACIDCVLAQMYVDRCDQA